jgi:hypothetical protein
MIFSKKMLFIFVFNLLYFFNLNSCFKLPFCNPEQKDSNPVSARDNQYFAETRIPIAYNSYTQDRRKKMQEAFMVGCVTGAVVTSAVVWFALTYRLEE